MGYWKLNPKKLDALAKASNLTWAEIATRAGYTERAIRLARKNPDRAQTEAMIKAIAGAVNAEARDIARPVPSGARSKQIAAKKSETIEIPVYEMPGRRRNGQDAPASAITIFDAIPVDESDADASALPYLAAQAPTAKETLEKLVNVQRGAPARPLYASIFGDLAFVGAITFKAWLAASKTHEKKRGYVVGTIEQFKGVSEEEGDALGGVYQRGARFNVNLEIVPGAVLELTIHTLGAEETEWLQSICGTGRRVTIVVILLCAHEEKGWIEVTDLGREGKHRIRTAPIGKSRTMLFELFWKKKRKKFPFALVVEEVVDGVVGADGEIVAPEGARATIRPDLGGLMKGERV